MRLIYIKRTKQDSILRNPQVIGTIVAAIIAAIAAITVVFIETEILTSENKCGKDDQLIMQSSVLFIGTEIVQVKIDTLNFRVEIGCNKVLLSDSAIISNHHFNKDLLVQKIALEPEFSIILVKPTKLILNTEERDSNVNIIIRIESLYTNPELRTYPDGYRGLNIGTLTIKYYFKIDGDHSFVEVPVKLILI